VIETGVSYFSSRDLRHVRQDLDDMVAQDCTYVVHCFTETDLLYYRRTVQDVVNATRDAGLEAWLDPWGVTGIFSGESLSRFLVDHPEALQLRSDGRRAPAACPNHPETRRFLREWVEASAYIGGDVLFWDEPHFYVTLWHGDRSGAWACRCDICRELFRDRFGGEIPGEFTPEVKAFREASLVDALTELCHHGRAKGLRNALCLIPTDLADHGFTEPQERLQAALTRLLSGGVPGAVESMLHIGVGDFERAAAIPDLDIFGSDPYWYLFGTPAEPFMRKYGELTVDAARKHGREVQFWVQAFSVPDGREEELRTGLRVAEELGATHVAAWSYDATRSMSKIACPRADDVWRIIGEEFRRLRG